jgi:predicted glycoside hydrolase/deacetylase ChbG (UPF0249 family)
MELEPVRPTANIALRELGFGPRDRVVVIHADDVGMCQATIPAFLDLVEAGMVTAASAMPPCPWFPEVAAICRKEASIDMGVHLTFTSEWSKYRWGPISTRNPESGLCSRSGYFYSTQAEFQANATVESVTTEAAAQVNYALAEGIDVTHIDNHMFALCVRKFLTTYTRLAARYNVPAVLYKQRLVDGVYDEGPVSLADEVVPEWRDAGYPAFDILAMPHLRNQLLSVEGAKTLFESLPVGLTTIVLHPAQDTPELRAMTPKWEFRTIEYKVFLDAELRRHVRNLGIQLIGYKDLRRVMRGSYEVLHV